MKKFIVFAFFMILALSSSTPLYAAPDPGIIHEKRADAKIHIKGLIVKDALIKEHKSPVSQERVMTVKIERILRVDPALDWHVKQEVDIPYSYIPGWGHYSGSKSIQVRGGDKIELWATIEKGQPSLVLGGYGIEILNSAGSRIEHIKEPLDSKWSRWQSNDRSLTVIILICLGMATIFVYALTSKFGHEKKA
ncbi:hypothetical protein [Falsibacillus pallidus]|uniref:Uncharacterized protein n=1 Tax=Falsibacillus pallidus TaxID=493781 RepID=A0A370G1V8_9BACI|nr:hypothetical protein [Falsibacillus pallidus]RDI36946.1 hypothetical protein DFR59_12433 [Falsibacillus pallidus]